MSGFLPLVRSATGHMERHCPMGRVQKNRPIDGEASDGGDSTGGTENEIEEVSEGCGVRSSEVAVGLRWKGERGVRG